MPRAVDYETHGRGYARGRQTDPRIEARIHAALGDARTVLNVGAGTGSYEPRDREQHSYDGALRLIISEPEPA